MTKTFHEAGDIELETLDLISYDKNRRLSLLGMTDHISLFESVHKKYLQAEIYVLDGLDLINGFPIIGEETIEISFRTPGVDRFTNLSFAVIRPDNELIAKNAKNLAYKLNCVSQEVITNSYQIIDKGYGGKLISEMIADIVAVKMKSTKQTILEETLYAQTLVIANKAPFEAIDFLARRAVSRYPSSSFLFFENARGYMFSTIENLFNIGKATIGNKLWTYDPNINQDDKQMSTEGYRNILSMDTIGRFDTLQKIQNGMYRNVTNVFDVFTKKYKQVEFNLLDQLEKFTFIDKDVIKVNTDNFMRSVSKERAWRYHTIMDGDVSTRPPSFREESIGIKNVFFDLVFQNQTRIMIHGDSTITAGDVIQLDLNKFKATTDEVEKNDFIDKNYMITTLRHDIYFGQRMKHRITMDLIKGNYS